MPYDAKMKKATSNKATPKLVLHREALRELANVELKRVVAGRMDTGGGCVEVVLHGTP